MTIALLSERVPHEVNSLVASDLTGAEWTLWEPTYQCARVATQWPGVYEINPDQDAQVGGGVYAAMPAPDDAVECVLEAEIRLPEGVASSSPIALVIYIPSTGAFTPTTVTPTGEWQKVRVRRAAVPGATHQISIATYHTGVGATGQGQCLARNVRAWYEGGGSIPSLPFRRFDISGEPFVFSFNDAPHALGGRRPITQEPCIFKTNAKRIGVRWWSTLSAFPNQAPLAVRINGDTVTALAPSAFGTMLYSEVDLPDLGEDVTVEVLNGIQGDHPLIWGGASDPIGTYMHALVVPDEARITFVRRWAERRILFEGASIVSGWSADLVQKNSWFAMVRDQLEADGKTIVRARAWGWRPAYTICHDAAAITAYLDTIDASGYEPTDFVFDLETNDYAGPSSNGDGGGVWSAADYGAGKAALFAAVLARYPNATIWAPTMMVRTEDATSTPNAHGDTPQDYRDALAAVASLADPRVRLVDALPFLVADDLADACHPKHNRASKVARPWIDLLR
jgi:hypothetical protein